MERGNEERNININIGKAKIIILSEEEESI